MHKYKLLILLIALGFTVFFMVNREPEGYVAIDSEAITPAESLDHKYYQTRKTWDADPVEGVDKAFSASDLSNESRYLDSFERDAFSFEKGDSITLDVTMDERGEYRLALDMMDVGSGLLENELAVKINGEYPYEESEFIELPVEWAFIQDDFSLDRYGNEILPMSKKIEQFEKTHFYDSTGLNAEPLTFLLEEGNNTIELINKRGDLEVSAFFIESVEALPSYDEYLSAHEGELIDDALIVKGAEDLSSKTNPSTRLMSVRDYSATAYDTNYQRLNALDGYSFRHGNNTISYEIEVPESGYYHLGFKYQQDFLMQMPVFREIKINGEIPFEEVAMMPFNHSESFTNTLLNDGGDPFRFYFEEGTNTVSLRVVLEPYQHAYDNLTVIMDEISELSLDVKKVTGNTQDRYRQWDMKTYIPDIEDRFDRWIERLEHIEEELSAYSDYEEPGELTNLEVAITQLKELRQDVDEVPHKMQMLADGDSSTAQLLGLTIQYYLENGLSLEKLYVSGTEDLPSPRASYVRQGYEATKRFFMSFGADEYAIGDVEDDTLEIWVNHQRQHVEIMQQIIDSEFTPETGIKVKLSIMPDENKLILANSADKAPDVAMGVNHWIPYEFAIRNASLDLRQFDGYEETVSNYSKGAMVPYAYEDGVYGIPQNQNFWVTYYREDIVEGLDLTVPDTWNDVVEVLPELQRYQMNYYEPIALHGGFKPFVSTLPFIHQFGGELYSEDGMSTLINSEDSLEGMQLMSELFTVYNVPKEVPNFYNHFRFGLYPMGISDLSTYLQLSIAAPELQGKWNIAPHPGVENDEEEVVRFAASGQQSNMIISTTEMPDESWEFLEWWSSTEIQSEFALRMQTTYGAEYLWNTANLEAFRELPIPEEHIDVILEQWDYALEASRVPGAYMVEREISNAWNRIVFNDANPRIALDNAVRVSNREILYRMEEFGYAENGEILKPYRVPTIHNIDYWLKERDDND
ncbi:MAG: extracellular solute-binding protein [Bacillota bacterium]